MYLITRPDWSRANHVAKNHTSFFLQLKRLSGQQCSIALKLCQRSQLRGQKTGSFCIVYYQKQIHLVQTLPFQKDSGMDQQLSIQSSSQAKSRGDENRDSNDNLSEHEETATRATKHVYPWMTEFRTKGTKQYLIRFRKYWLGISKSYFTEQLMGVDLNQCAAVPHLSYFSGDFTH